ncbi:MAG TPA: transglutaminase domain-containing protein [Candidatus Dormibacteraeota bacterium]|nr:transglutaminase domain-containing protein [Candidatus Dormibacteraeota bacterium]
MRYVSPDTVLGRPEGFDEGVLRSAIYDRAREWLGGGRFWAALIVLLLTVAISKSTATVQWVPGIDVIVPVAILAAVLMSVLALLPIAEPIALSAGVVIGLAAAIVAAWPKLHASHPEDPIGLRLIGTWWSRLQDGSAIQDPSFWLLLVSLLMWITGGWLAWCVLRWRKPMLGLIPGAAAFATNVLNFPNDQNGYVLAILVLTLALLLWTNYTSSISNAGQASVKLTGDAKWDFWESGLVAMAALIVLGIMLPPLSTTDRTLALESSVFTSWAQLQQRLNNPGIFTQTATSHGVTGFTDQVKLTGALQQSRDVVFEWTVTGDYAGPKYFRGINETFQTGGEWRYAPQDGFQEVLASNAFPPYSEDYLKLAGATIHVTMRAPPTGFTSVLFYPGQLVRINRTAFIRQVPLETGAADNSLQSIDRLDSIHPNTSAGGYAVQADFSTATQSDLQSAGTQYADWLAPFMIIPRAGYRSPDVLSAIHNRAQQIVQAAGATNPYDMASAIEAYLRNPSNFKYSLAAQAPAGVDKIFWFLFDGHVGYCEFFATAMGDMLRSLGIPTRLVNGFGPGQFNSQTESNVVRGQDAHTWVEVYFPSYGWIPFEPTPDDQNIYQPIPRGQTGTNPCFRDSNCDPGGVVSGPTGGVLATPKTRPGLEGPNIGTGGTAFSVQSVSGNILTKAAGVLVALLLLLLVAASRYLRPRSVMSVWKRMLVLANLAGAERRPGETPLELGRRLQRTFPEAAAPMRDLTGAFAIAAYAPPEEASQQRGAIMESWVALRPVLLRRAIARLRPRPL